MSAPSSIYHTKNRIVSVDMVRLIAAFAVMYEHLTWFGGGTVTHFLAEFPYLLAKLSPLFFFLAGYFACRNITWKKALNNAWWSFAPFVLWNTIAIAFAAARGELSEHYNILTLYGVQSIFIEGWALFPQLNHQAWPIDAPLWFMRDLIFLFLLSPFLARWSKIVFPVCIIASLIPALAPGFAEITSTVVMSPRSIAFFAGGCLLQTFSKERQRAALCFYSPVFIITYLLIMSLDALTCGILCSAEPWNLCKNMLGIWVIYQIARWIEVKCPRATPIALKYAPVTFLTFAAHMLVYPILCHLNWRLHPLLNGTSLEGVDLNGTDLVLLFPPACFALMAAFFFAMKRWCPALLHLVAHYKLRPDDLKPAPGKRD